MDKVILLLAIFLVMSCDTTKVQNEIVTQEDERVQAFMSGKVRKDGAWVSLADNKENIEDFVFDLSLVDFPHKLKLPSDGVDFMSTLKSRDNLIPETDWEEISDLAIETIENIDRRNLDDIQRLVSYELVLFAVLRHFLNQVTPSEKAAELSRYFLKLLLTSGTIGELDLLAENFRRMHSYFPEDDEAEIRKLLKQRCHEVLVDNHIGSFRLEKTKMAQTLMNE